jgi:hypothetical protein
MSMPRWLRIFLLALVALGVVTLAAVLLNGVAAYVTAGVGVFVVLVIGIPLALRPPSAREGMRAAVAP